MDPNPGSLEGVELGHLPRIGLGQEGVGTNQPFQDGGEDSHDALALGDLLRGGIHLVFWEVAMHLLLCTINTGGFWMNGLTEVPGLVTRSSTET